MNEARLATHLYSSIKTIFFFIHRRLDLMARYGIETSYILKKKKEKKEIVKLKS